MTTKVYSWVSALQLKGRILDVGAFNVNGCLRPLFPEQYIGLDMRDGPNVDIVASSHAIPSTDNYFDHVCCVEMLEHDPDFFKSVKEMRRVLRNGGALVLTVPSISFPRHDYPCDYWRLTIDGLRLLFIGMHDIRTVEDTDHVYGVAWK